jgi:hypothetical protein
MGGLMGRTIEIVPQSRLNSPINRGPNDRNKRRFRGIEVVAQPDFVDRIPAWAVNDFVDLVRSAFG